MPRSRMRHIRKLSEGQSGGESREAGGAMGAPVSRQHHRRDRGVTVRWATCLWAPSPSAAPIALVSGVKCFSSVQLKTDGSIRPSLVKQLKCEASEVVQK